MKAKGFTLLELMVYLAALAFFAHLFFDYGAMVMAQMVGTEGEVVRYVNARMAFEVLVRDVRRASSAVAAWKKIMPGECVWHCPVKQKDISWSVHEGRLVRTMGTYDGAWRTKRSDTALREVEELSFEVLQGQGGVSAVRCRVCFLNNGKKRAIQQWIALRERVV